MALLPSRQARALFVLAAFISGTNAIVPLLPLYQERLGFSNGTFTALFSVYAAALLLPLLFLGTVSDQLGRKTVCLPGMVVMAAGSALYLVAEDSLALLFLARALHGVASGSFVGNMTAYVIDLGAEERRMRSSWLAGLVFTGGLAAAPLLAALVSAPFGDSLVTPWLLHLALVGLAFVLLLGLPETVQRRRQVSLAPRLGVPREALRPFLLFAVPAGFATFGLGSLGVGTLPLFMRQELDLTSTLSAGLAPGVLLAVSALAQAYGNRLVPETGARAGLLLMGGGLLLAAVTAYASFTPLLFLGAGVLGAGYGLGFGAVLALGTRAAPTETRGSVVSSLYLGSYFGFSLPVFYGYASLQWGTGDTYMGFAAVLALGVLFLATVAIRATKVPATGEAVLSPEF